MSDPRAVIPGGVSGAVGAGPGDGSAGELPGAGVERALPGTTVDGNPPSDGVDRALPGTTVDGNPPSDGVDRALPGTTVDGNPPSDGVADGGRAPGEEPRLRASDEMVRDALSEVYDPEIGIDIVSLGLVYGTHLEDAGLLTVDMTLTSPFCPLGSILEAQVHAVCAPLPGVDDVRVNLVWDPPWDPRTMASDEVKLELGIY